MKQVLFSLFLFVAFSVNAQNLTLIELQNLCKLSNWENGVELLTRKGWEFHDSKRGNDLEYSTISYAYGKNDWYEDRATAWFHFLTYNNRVEKISYQPTNNCFKNIKASLAANGYKQIDNQIYDNYILTTYRNQNFILNITTTTQKSVFSDATKVSYIINLIRKGGIYDEDNGEKFIYYDGTTTIKERCTIKDGKRNGQSYMYSEKGNIQGVFCYVNGELTGPYTVYNDDGGLSITGTLFKGKDNGLKTEYDDEGNKEVEYMCKNGVKNGRYISFYPDEKIKISGNFVNDECDGLWIEYDTIGRKIFETNYRNDKKNGSFVEYGYNEKYKENNGLCYKKIGSYVNDEKNGFWQRLFLKDGKWRNLDFSNYRNGILHGAAKEWKLGCDTIVFCNYNNGKLDGKYQVKGSLLRLQKAIYDDNLIVITDGCYNDGKKTGFWQYKDLFTFKLAEGVYENDKEEGEWKYYSYNNIFSHIANYHDGKLNGKYIAYKEQIAKNSLIPKETHAETIFIKDSIDFICYFKDGKRHGHYERHDNNGIVVMEGDYNNDKEQGQWIVIDIDNDEKCIANFNDGKLDGNKLVYSYATGKKLYTYNYRNGTCDGCQVWYKDSEKPFVEDWFQDGVMHKRVIFNSDGSRTEFNLLKRNFDSFLGRETSFLKENTKGIGSIAIEYKYNIDPDSVLYIPFVAFGKGQKILDGKYVVRDLENREIDEMEYSEGKKVGVWKHTDYKNNVCSYEDKSDLSKPKRFFCLDNQPYSGKFVIEDEKQEKRIVHKIKKSLIKEIVILDYKTGKVISKQKYKDGMPL